MKYLKVFENFNDIDSLCKKYGIKNYTIVDGLVNVDGNVDLDGKKLTNRFLDALAEIPIKFGHVSGDFRCHYNELTSLVGAPQSVGGDVDLGDNQLTSLEGAPNSVGGDFICSGNKLTSLEGAPNSVGGNFYCSNNQLTSLEGAPKSIGGHFYCYNNKLTSFEGCCENIGGDFYCFDNPLQEIWKLFRDTSKIEFFNYMDPIRPPENEGEEPICYLDILNEFLKEIGKDPVEKVNGYNCI